MVQFTDIGDVSTAEVERMRTVYGALAESVRELIDATIRTEVDADAVAAVKAEIDAATARLRSEAVRRAIRGALHYRWRSHGVGKPGDRDPQSDRTAADGSSTTPTAGCSPTFIWVRHTKVRRATCTGVSRRWSSTMCSEKWRPMKRHHASPAPSRCAICDRPGWESCMPRRESRGPTGSRLTRQAISPTTKASPSRREGVFIQPKWARG